jgi:hypothetical protein
MNIFYLDKDPIIAAQYHCDKHVVKMIVETAQLLSTAHRYNDGEEVTELNGNGRRMKRYKLRDAREQTLYLATHANHPSAVWCRQDADNYNWLYTLFIALLDEYKYRYKRDHACTKLIDTLRELPNCINTKPFTEPPPAMPLSCVVKGDSVQSYRKYYINEKKHFAKWTNRPVPNWFKENNNKDFYEFRKTSVTD